MTECSGGDWAPVFGDNLVWDMQNLFISVQNEPKAVQRWESCIYTAEEERVFIRDHLYPALVAANLTSVKIILWDHNKERAFECPRQILSDPKVYAMVHGVGVHWYPGGSF